MTVEELISELQKMPPKATVYKLGWSDGDPGESGYETREEV